jgi:hypothetical protein
MGWLAIRHIRAPDCPPLRQLRAMPNTQSFTHLIFTRAPRSQDYPAVIPLPGNLDPLITG